MRLYRHVEQITEPPAAAESKRRRRRLLSPVAETLIANLYDRNQAHVGGWTIVAADGSIDLTNPHGRAMASMAAVFAELERDLISSRTTEALAAAQRLGTRLGRPPQQLPPNVRGQVKRWRRGGLTLQAIADRLTQRGIATRSAASGGIQPRLPVSPATRAARELHLFSAQRA